MTTSHRSRFSYLSLACFFGLSFGCSPSANDSVTPRFEAIDQTKDTLSTAAITSITGTYGGSCLGRSGLGTDPWTISRSGGPAADELRVVVKDLSCVLTIENIVIDGDIYVGTPSITLDTTNAYKASASGFAINGEALAFYGNAKINALTFAEDFSISMLISDTPNIPEDITVTGVFGQDGSVPDLLSAESFAVLAGSTITNSGTGTVVNGDLGLFPGTSVTGLPAGQPMGATYLGGSPIAEQAKADLTTLYGDLAGRPCPVANDLSGQDLAGMTLFPGVYCFSATAALGIGNLTLDARNNPNAFWIFQIASTLSVSASTVTVINGGTPCNVFWQVGTSATVLDNALFAGNLVAFTSITLNSNASLLPGRVLAGSGAVTMLTNQVSKAACQ